MKKIIRPTINQKAIPETLTDNQQKLLNQLQATGRGVSILQIHKLIKELNIPPADFIVLTQREIIRSTKSGRFIYP